MKKLYSVLALVVLITLVSLEKLQASHMVGLNITYVQTGPNQYIVTVKFYRDCDGIGAPSTISLQYDSPSGCGASGSVTLSQIPGTGQEIQTGKYPPCGTTSCNIDPVTGQRGNGYGIQEYVYSGPVTLPAACSDWVLSWSSCCRNSALTTASPGSMYVETTLDNATIAWPDTNWSPDFAYPPVATFCVGKTVQFQQGAIDADGDSLVYSLVDALDAAGNPITYTPPYSGTNPIASAPPVSIDPQTGTITMNPTTVQVGVIAILVEEYRNGVLIGTIRRDMQVNIEAVCNEPPGLDTIRVTMNNLSAPCGDSALHLSLSYTVLCSTVAPDGSDFRLLSPSNIPILIKGAIYHNCSSAGLTDSISLLLTRPLCENGLYTLFSKKGYDGNTLLNGCLIAMAEYDSMLFRFTNCFPGKPDMANVSVDQSSDYCIATWREPVGLDRNQFQSYDVFRSDNGPAGFYKYIGSTYNWYDTTYNDKTANPNVQTYSYGAKVHLNNCYISPMSDTIQSIYFTCSPDLIDTTKINLNWTSYWGWQNPNYEIWLDDGVGGTFSYSGSTTSNTSYSFSKPLDQGNYNMRVLSKNQGLTALSNICSFDAYQSDPIVENNVITPNNDGLNEIFEVRNIESWPDNTVSIFNRWGKKVYETSGYKNDWKGGGLEDGTYYYVVQVNGRKSFDFHGTINIFNK